jgi:hypothetical protein
MTVAACLLLYVAATLAICVLADTSWPMLKFPRVRLAFDWLRAPRLTDRQALVCLGVLLAMIFAALVGWEMGIAK